MIRIVAMKLFGNACAELLFKRNTGLNCSVGVIADLECPELAERRWGSSCTATLAPLPFPHT
jgi:hypothetical protein